MGQYEKTFNILSSEDVIISDYKKIRISLTQLKKKEEYINIDFRVWCRSKTNSDYYPTSQGFSISGYIGNDFSKKLLEIINILPMYINEEKIDEG